MESIFIFLGIIIVIVTVTVVGHVLWLLFATLIAAIFGRNDRSHEAGSRPGQSLSSAHKPTPSIKSDLAAAKRLVEYAHFRNWLPPEQLEMLTGLIASFAQRISSERASPVDLPLKKVRRNVPPFSAAVDHEPVSPKPLVPESVSEPPVQQPIHPLEEPEPAIAFGSHEQGLPQPPAARQPMSPPEAAQYSVKPQRTKVPLSANVMRAFMEQSNIRWIELISATLIVVCSVGLVISLWSTLSATSRYFPSLVFLLATAAVHAAGQYTLRKWKLRSTSRGILHIGLMLIPLAVLVGILLSERPGQPPRLDVMTIAVLAVGTVLYGGAALTASKALFAGRYLPVAASVILGAMTLVPIHFLGASRLLGHPLVPAILIPLIAAGLYNVLMLSELSCRQTLPSSGRARRMATHVLQVIFAAAVPAYFWLMRAGGFSAVSDTAITFAGLILAGWASWGWTVSTAFPSSRAIVSGGEKGQSRIGGTWLSVVGLGLACICSLGIAAILWRTSGSRLVFASYLLMLALWWICHGWRCRMFVSLLAGSVAGILALALAGEWTVPGIVPNLLTADWIALPRIASISLASVGVGVVGCILAYSHSKKFEPVAESTSPVPRGESSPRMLATSLVTGSGLCLIGTAGLTTLASFVSWSDPAYGGNWAPVLLMVYGLVVLGAGIVIPRISSFNWDDGIEGQTDNAGWLRYLIPAGQAILLLGVVRGCQSAPMVPEWISELRPHRAWSVGSGLLSLLWASMAAVVYRSGLRYQQQNSAFGSSATGSTAATAMFSVRCLSFGAIALSLASSAVYWTNGDRLQLAGSLGWVLPLTLVLACIVLRSPAIREWSAVATAGWVVTLLISLGLRYAWWERIGVTAAASVIVASVLLVVGVYELLLKSLLTRKTETGTHWLWEGKRWASVDLLSICWLALILSLFYPAVLQLLESLKLANLPNARGFWQAEITPARTVPIFLTLLALSGLTYWIGHEKNSLLRSWLAIVPVAIAVLVGCISPVPYCIPVSLWVLAASMVLMEVLSLTNSAIGRRLREFQPASTKGSSQFQFDNWLVLTSFIGLGVLASGTLFMVVACAAFRLPESLLPLSDNMTSWIGWVANLSRIAQWIAPLVILLSIRWFTALWNAVPAVATVRRGFALGTLLTLTSGLAGAVELESIVLLTLQSFTLIMVIIAWKTISFATTWNWYGLRKLDRTSSSQQLLVKACGGSRWKQAEKAAWNLWMGAIFAAGALSLAAAILVFLYPSRPLPELHRLGSWWTLLSVASAVAFWWLLGPRRGFTRFALLALSMGMIAPIAATGYASWLINHPAAKFASVFDFEPYRLLVSLWLASLVLGLVIRFRAALRAQPLSYFGEFAWVVLAGLVGVFAVRSLESDSSWASAYLTLLAVIIALSAECSGQAWRGWIAAIAGMLAWFPWISGGGRSDWLFYPWQALWGATGVGFICIAARLGLRRLGIASHPALAGPGPRQEDLSNTVSGADSEIQTNPRPTLGSPRMTVDRGVCLLVSSLSIALSGFWILMQGSSVAAPNPASWVVGGLLIGNVVLAIARLGDVGPSQRGLSVYLSALAATVVLVNLAAAYWRLPRLQAELAWLSGFLGAMAFMAALLKESILQRLPLQRLFSWNDLITEEKLRKASDWMASWHTLAALLCLFPSIWLVLNLPDVGGRLTAIALPMLGAAAIWPLSSERQRAFQKGSVLLLISATLILAWWADLPAAWTLRQDRQSWLFVHRTFMACVALAIAYPLVAWRRSLLYGQDRDHPASDRTDRASLAQPESPGPTNDSWSPALFAAGWICLGLASVVGIGMIVGTWHGHWSDFPANASFVVKCLTLFAWGTIFARLLQSAARPFVKDRFTDLRSRTLMVYAAEIAVVLGGIAAYQHFPYLFSGIFLEWWPLIVFGIAFVSAGIGQLLQRANQPVLADPIHQSSLLLPLIPLAGVWWAGQDSTGANWGEWGSYWFLLASASGLYGLYGWIRNSLVLRTMSAGVALLSFWALLLSRPELQFFDRPQVWLLPPAIASLIFVEWNRKKLDLTTVTIARYVCILVAYLSSSAEVFLRAVGGNLWQPILLLIFALGGVLAGMLLQVRAFLYCGATFILVALFGMVWHAAQAIDQVWPWWVFGIATGVGLIVLLGYFEKNRSKVLKYFEELRSWQS